MSDRVPLLDNEMDYQEIQGGIPLDNRPVISEHHIVNVNPFDGSNTYQQQQQQQSTSPNNSSYISSNNNNTNNINIGNSNNNTPSQIKKKKKDKLPAFYSTEVEQPVSFDDFGITEETNPSEVKHQIQNHMFGFKPFKSKLTKRRIEERSPEIQSLYTDTQKETSNSNSLPVLIGNIFYCGTFGILLFIVFSICSLILFITYFGIPYGKLFWKLKNFVLWPFGKYLQLSNNDSPYGLDEENIPISSGSGSSRRRAQTIAVRKLTLYNYIGVFIYYLFIAPIIIIFEAFVLSLSWMLVVFIPTAKIHTKLLTHLLSNPLTLRVEDYPRADCQILLYPVEAFNKFYYKYTINGMNVVLVNLLPFVIISLIFGFFLEDKIDPIVIFICCLLSTIPLSYYNGMAIASLSAQTSFAIGALINASFGSIIELILYVVSINGAQEEVARSALTGALLGSMLLIPGLSMVIGGLKHKEQRFNPTLMGVNTILLMVAVIAAFAPTLFYKVYGSFGFSCTSCTQQPFNSTIDPTNNVTTTNALMDCAKCSIVSSDLDDDPIYTQKARTLMYICSGILPLTYFIGLLFTLKTHTHILHAPLEKKKAEIAHGEPKAEKSIEYEWSKLQCIIVLLACTTMFALVSEKLVDTIDPVVSALGLTHEFLGVTILGIIPSAAEYLNAVQFAIHNNMPLALEIGASAAVQITLFQMPVLVFICAILNHLSSQGSFTLIFPLMDFFAIFFAVMVMNLVFSNGRTNYFIGSTLVIIYLVIVFCFYFTPIA